MGHNFKKLLIWQKSMDLSDLIYTYTESLPSKERFVLCDQLNRSSVSIPSNIAEGCGKRTKKHFAEFLSIALSSAYEAETQLLICKRRKYGKVDELEEALVLVEEVQKMIFVFKEKIEREI
ncbi:MAG: four helix bundle protein [Bacteroidota bacterium]|nr:four helix bundle protein [Bacteroidota bacterium]